MALLGGSTADGGGAEDYWEWDGAEWSLRTQDFMGRHLDHVSMPQNARPGGNSLLAFGGRLASRMRRYGGPDPYINSGAGGVPGTLIGAGGSYDPRSGFSYMFGGELDDGGVSDQAFYATTSMDLWYSTAPPVRPPARSFSQMAFDLGTQSHVLFGGRSGAGTSLADVWSFDGGTWSPLSPSGSISPRHAMAMASVPAESRIFVFGGTNGSDFKADFWELNVGRSGHARRAAVLFAFRGPMGPCNLGVRYVGGGTGGVTLYSCGASGPCSTPVGSNLSATPQPITYNTVRSGGFSEFELFLAVANSASTSSAPSQVVTDAFEATCVR